MTDKRAELVEFSYHGDSTDSTVWEVAGSHGGVLKVVRPRGFIIAGVSDQLTIKCGTISGSDIHC
jgi:hypothetical protein